MLKPPAPARGCVGAGSTFPLSYRMSHRIAGEINSIDKLSRELQKSSPKLLQCEIQEKPHTYFARRRRLARE